MLLAGPFGLRVDPNMPTEDIEFYVETRDLWLDVLCLDLIRQLSHLVWRVLQVDSRESSYIDEIASARRGSLASTVWHFSKPTGGSSAT